MKEWVWRKNGTYVFVRFVCRCLAARSWQFVCLYNKYIILQQFFSIILKLKDSLKLLSKRRIFSTKKN